MIYKLSRPTKLHQLETYYFYWCSKIIQINMMLESGDEQEGKSLFKDCISHLDPFLESLSRSRPLHGLPRDVLIDIVCRLEPSIKSIFTIVFTPMQSINLLRVFLRIFCEGDDSGTIKEER